MSRISSPQKQSLIGQSGSLMETLDQVSRVAPLKKPVLIIGERGTGKELIADRIHYLSERWDHPFLKLNCASMNENLLESELFGHEAGAFTGALKTHKGRFERAHQGTLFLDELATSSQRVQEQLLRVIEYGEFERLGGHQPVHTDVRLVAATNQDLLQMVEENQFRADLLDRLTFDVIHLPPLRYRRDDIPMLADHFAIAMIHELGRPFFPGFTPRAMEQLQNWDWPGNIRELKNVVERAVCRSADEQAAIGDITFRPLQSPWSADQTATTPDEPHSEDQSLPVAGQPYSEEPFHDQVREFETGLIRRALRRCRFNQRRTAERLGLSYHQLRGLLKKYQLSGNGE